MTDLHTTLTDADFAFLEALGVHANGEIQAPEVPSLELHGHTTSLGSHIKLSDTTKKAMAKKRAKQHKRQAAAKAISKGMPKGRRHFKSKQATAKRRANTRWRVQPYKSTVYGYGVWAISQEEWDRCIAHLWLVYEPLSLKVKRRWGKGTHSDPYTIYDIDIVHDIYGVVYKGQDQLIVDSSEPNALDIEKAPEGALLFAVG